MIAIILSTGILTAQSSQPVTTRASAGQAIQDAAKAAAQDRVVSDSDQSSPEKAVQRAPDTSKATVPTHTKFGWATILTTTGRVSVGPYADEVLSKVRLKWWAAVRASEHARYAHAKLAIQFVVHKDGSVSGVKLTEPSDDETLNRAARNAVMGAAPFAPLPADLTDGYLQLCLRFFYNPSKADLRESRQPGPHSPM